MAILLAGLLRARRARRPESPRLLWGTQPIIALTYLSRAMRAAGYESSTVATDLYSIVRADDFDHLITLAPGNVLVSHMRHSLARFRFLAAVLGDFDVFHYYFDSGLLTHTALARLEYPLIKAAGARLVLFPYGSDAFVYDAIPSLELRAALMLEYAANGNRAAEIEERIRRGTRYADCVVGCLVHVVNLPRWDVLPLTCYPVDSHALEPTLPTTEGTVRIAHASNHRGFKGTDQLIAAVDRLRDEGYDVELDLIEGQPNHEALAVIAAADIYVDQLVTSYAMAALEAMALGKVVVGHLPDTEAYRIFRRYSYLDECPLVSASVEDVRDVLAGLIERREDWPEIGRASRAFCERRHSPEAAAEMYEAIYRRIYHGEDVDLVNFYHPLPGARRTPGSQR